MALNMDILRKKLEALTSGNSSSDYTPPKNIWKPSEGINRARILPLKGEEFAFKEAHFHYFPRNTLVSPLTYGNNDIIADFVNRTLDDARESGNLLSVENFKRLVKLRPVLRTYALVIVRGEEELGPRWYGFGKKNYTRLLKSIAEEDIGDITDFKTGRDITIEYIPKAKSPTSFAQSDITIAMKESVLSDDPDQIKKWLNNYPSFAETFPAASTDELQAALERYISALERSVSTDVFMDAKSSKNSSKDVVSESEEDDEVLDDEDESSDDEDSPSAKAVDAFDEIFKK